MKRLILALLLASATLAAQPLTQGERNRAMSDLHASRKMFLDSIDGLSEAQWKFKPAPDRWSVAECAEHMALIEDALFERVTEEVMKTPRVSAKSASERAEKDALVLTTVRNRDEKLHAPDHLQPTGRWASKEALVRHFKQSRDRTIAYIEKTDEELRNHVAPHPRLGQLDAYQRILLLSAHSERHVAQIREVKQHPDFPIN